MALYAHNGRLYEPVFGFNSQVSFVDMGPHIITRKDRALVAMVKLEKRGQTGRKLYDIARRIAYREIGWTL